MGVAGSASSTAVTYRNSEEIAKAAVCGHNKSIAIDPTMMTHVTPVLVLKKLAVL